MHMDLTTDFQVERNLIIETAIYSALTTRSTGDNNPSPLALNIPNFRNSRYMRVAPLCRTRET